MSRSLLFLCLIHHPVADVTNAALSLCLIRHPVTDSPIAALRATRQPEADAPTASVHPPLPGKRVPLLIATGYLWM